jgi:hypothetical protein
MSTKWFYKNKTYETEAEVNQAVLDFKDRLDNSPTDWCIVKELTGSVEDGWVIPTTGLTDAQINTLDESKNYSIASIISGGNETGLPASQAAEKVAEYRTEYAQYMTANMINKVYAPENVDMSAYI